MARAADSSRFAVCGVGRLVAGHVVSVFGAQDAGSWDVCVTMLPVLLCHSISYSNQCCRFGSCSKAFAGPFAGPCLLQAPAPCYSNWFFWCHRSLGSGDLHRALSVAVDAANAPCCAQADKNPDFQGGLHRAAEPCDDQAWDAEASEACRLHHAAGHTLNLACSTTAMEGFLAKPWPLSGNVTD